MTSGAFFVRLKGISMTSNISNFIKVANKTLSTNSAKYLLDVYTDDLGIEQYIRANDLGGKNTLLGTLLGGAVGLGAGSLLDSPDSFQFNGLSTPQMVGGLVGGLSLGGIGHLQDIKANRNRMNDHFNDQVEVSNPFFKKVIDNGHAAAIKPTQKSNWLVSE